ncbi:CMP-N-acetylneuraminate-beta-galactosamide-alpha-2,3-sialyltransferase 1 [Pelodiscus sinensis]|uniref:CMP-N-acetylneuraminate-beta-galactosamide-alpha-2,3-sialyltransferase 1 n=1 Tax=Pelodiscus sinensis TaxID=13735 RepID=K7FA34_PELSI|nr:CMP-N-acetylneuraminate-beta-galactosamide-alpha-2,3-sialyltransferase 1 [Pelodiscus sinensis]XP_006123593.1 CMP-N-acetylneuraminate-beta-galactosamide-alpha-2,3-sialyltransferase 1 [Pelodiscus sinensis]XP_006123594.1 CMP-N-acetylneuraminate-beta-galactosamide-alpha-2,3-sialyltransferase 1 [Pelodiscus sinensis]XP_006123595.1 CMP-N-acetylneuraminate-beta-galactosamide-alpha-2,3-sialyltransferase 1 [Pelodiscus sinensis]|eukprot:XP_006123592.1 CMP-N-acetylneuraminate-beta-galactosamide-alpha-2,3-sialyltransferase 1 [Pelodiscus sinensis]
MVAIKKKNLKMFSLALLFVITVTSFLLNYTHNAVMVTWDPKQIVMQVSEHFKKLMKYPQRPCSCHSCVSELGLSFWFDERLNQTIQPFLTTRNALIPEESYKWWLKLQGESNPKNINDTIKELFEVIPGDGEQLLERDASRCRRCAVVGNSGNLKQSQYGREIDAHDFVLRMNRAPTAGFETDVGSKTTHHFVYPESFQDLAENVSMIVIPFKTLDLRWIVSALTTGTINFTYAPVPRKIKVKRDKILVYHPRFIKYVYDHWLQHHGRYPSTGILSVIFALHLCDEVDVYGFGADSNGNWHHYWENNPSAGAFRQTKVHDGDFESNITLTLASIDKIHFFKGR